MGCSIKPINNTFVRINPQGGFEKYFYNTNIEQSVVINVNGAIDIDDNISALRRKITDKLKYAKTKEHLEEIMRYLVYWIHLQRKSKKIGQLIGEDCTAVCIDTNYKMSLHFFGSDNELKRFPNLVGQNQCFENLVLLGDHYYSIDTSAPSPLPDGCVGIPYSQIITIEGGLPPYHWSIVSGTLPSGLSLDETDGTIKGVPTQNTRKPMVITMRITDARSNASDRSLSIHVTMDVKPR